MTFVKKCTEIISIQFIPLRGSSYLFTLNRKENFLIIFDLVHRKTQNLMFFSCLSVWHVIHETTWTFTPFLPPPQLSNKIAQNTLHFTIVITIKGALKISFVFPKKIHFSAINTTSWEFTDVAVDVLQWGNKLYLVLISSFQRTNQSIVNINRSPTHLTS